MWPVYASNITSILLPIDEFYNNASKFDDGKVADYIPQLAKLNPDVFGVSICTVDGQRYSIGDCTDPFTLQSCWYVILEAH